MCWWALPVAHWRGVALILPSKERPPGGGEPLSDKIIWQNGNEYTFRLRPGTYMQSAMLVPQPV